MRNPNDFGYGNQPPRRYQNHFTCRKKGIFFSTFPQCSRVRGNNRTAAERANGIVNPKNPPTNLGTFLPVFPCYAFLFRYIRRGTVICNLNENVHCPSKVKRKSIRTPGRPTVATKRTKLAGSRH